MCPLCKKFRFTIFLFNFESIDIPACKIDDTILLVKYINILELQNLEPAEISSFGISQNEVATKCNCDTIKGNESLVENFNFNFLTPLSQNFKRLHFDTNPMTIGYLVTEL